MFRKKLACIAMLCALVAQSSQAAPIFNVTPGAVVAGNRQWAVTITPDASLFANNPPNGVGGSVAAEFGFMVGPGSLVSIIKDATNFPADNPGTVIPGYPNGFGVQMSGNKATAFLGSNYFTTATPKLMVTITTLGAGPTTIEWLGAYSGNGRIAQGGTNFDLYKGKVSVVPEPASLAMLPIAGLGLAFGYRRRS